MAPVTRGTMMPKSTGRRAAASVIVNIGQYGMDEA